MLMKDGLVLANPLCCAGKTDEAGGIRELLRPVSSDLVTGGSWDPVKMERMDGYFACRV